MNAAIGTHLQLPIPTFGVFVVTAIVISAGVFRKDVWRLESLGTIPALTHTRIADLVLISVIAGLVGARVFSILDYPEQFLQHPAAMIFTRTGFSIYGGLCFGLLTGVIFLRKYAIPILPTLDAAAPSMMLGYAIGRLGCQFSGDGDWGIASNMQLKPGWLPDWIWAQTYEGNISGVVLPGGGVYPTPVYETAMALVLFGALLMLRSRRYQPGFLFSTYLMFAGFERLLIEKIRINVDYHLFGLAFTQAEAISFTLVLAGLAGAIATLGEHRVWTRGILSVAVISALSACAKL
ncbi:MAG TPA: prolipoprotein diacylglyceryl transferase family protein [Steroidobacteraceae bacterium]